MQSKRLQVNNSIMHEQIKIDRVGNQARVQALSHARLSNYRSFFGAADDAEALGLYQWNEEMSAVFSARSH